MILMVFSWSVIYTFIEYYIRIVYSVSQMTINFVIHIPISILSYCYYTVCYMLAFLTSFDTHTHSV